jgi:hypothetical protein
VALLCAPLYSLWFGFEKHNHRKHRVSQRNRTEEAGIATQT